MTVIITVTGGLTAPPELRYSSSGLPILSGTVASTDRYLDKQSNEWKDGKSLYLRWTAFKDLAEHIAASQLEKGSQVAVTGKLHTRSFEDREGQKRSVTELEVIDFSVSLRHATAVVSRAARQDTRGGAGTDTGGSWDTATVPGAQAGAQPWGGGSDAETPF